MVQIAGSESFPRYGAGTNTGQKWPKLTNFENITN